MAYTVRDVAKALFTKINASNLSVVQDGKNVRVRVLVGTPDEAIAQKRYPSINVYPGFRIKKVKNWQSVMSTSEIDGNLHKANIARNIDFFYSFKIGGYALFNEHISYLENYFLMRFPNDFCLNVISESDGLSYPTQVEWDGEVVNLDEYRKATANTALAESEIEADQKVLRREFIVTAHLSMEESSVETNLRPFAGVGITVEPTLNS